MPISPITNYIYSTLAFLVSRAIKPLYLFSRTKMVTVLAAVWPFENTQDAIVYNEFLEVAKDNKE